MWWDSKPRARSQALLTPSAGWSGELQTAEAELQTPGTQKLRALQNQENLNSKSHTVACHKAPSFAEFLHSPQPTDLSCVPRKPFTSNVMTPIHLSITEITDRAFLSPLQSSMQKNGRNVDRKRWGGEGASHWHSPHAPLPTTLILRCWLH